MNAEPALERLAKVEGRVEEHSRMVEDIAGRFTHLEGRLDRVEANVNARFERVDARFEHLEASVNARFDHVEGKIDGVRDGLDGKIERLDGKLTSYFTWMVGLTFASWLSTMYQLSRVVR